jgi:glutathione S-transferase
VTIRLNFCTKPARRHSILRGSAGEISWDLINGKFLAQTEVDSPINVVLFAPQRYWVVIGTEQGIKVWDTLAIAEYLNEIRPQAHLLPADRAARAHCRAVCGEMHSGFSALRSALPMNLRAQFPNFRVWSRAQDDIERIVAIWRECLQRYGGPWLFGKAPGMADAMYAPVVTRFLTYDVKLDPDIAEYCATVLKHPFVREWMEAAQLETEDIDELDVEF